MRVSFPAPSIKKWTSEKRSIFFRPGFRPTGANVTVVSRKRENVDAACSALKQLGGQVLGVYADVRDVDSVGQAMTTTVAELGSIDVLILGAAGNFLCEAKDMSSNGFTVVVDIDLNGTFNVMRQALAHMRKPDGVFTEQDRTAQGFNDSRKMPDLVQPIVSLCAGEDRVTHLTCLGGCCARQEVCV